MQIAVSTIFVLLCAGAPWISRKWGWRGELAWGIAVLTFIISTILILN
jgi:hypothetical protein